MTVRRLGVGDEALLAGIVATFKGVSYVDSRDFLADRRCYVWIAESEDSVVGWCWAHELGRPDGRRDLLLYELEVAAQHRRQGHGRALLEAVLAARRLEGHGSVWLVTDDSNESAQALYRAAGGADRQQVLVTWPQVER